MAHPVTCVYCHERFDRDKEDFVQISERRYAHKQCTMSAQQLTSQQDRDYEELIAYIKKLFKMPVVSNQIVKQVKEFHQDYKYSYSGIRKTLYWFYELKDNKIPQENKNIGIVPYIYNEASDYFYRLYLAEIASNNIIKQIPVKEYTIKSPILMHPYKEKQMFNLGEDSKDE